VALLLAERRLGEAARRRPAVAIVIAFGLALGALLFAGSLTRGHYASWPGVIGGIVCAGLATAATAPLLARVSSRLGGRDTAALPLYAEGGAVLLGVLTVLAPPIGVIAVLLLAWLLLAGRRREGQKYAGLRILR
jgi:hypothetical protein